MPDAASIARTLRLVWGAVAGGGLMVLLVFGGLTATSPDGSFAEHAETVFYGIAVLSVGALAAAFAVLRQMETRLLQAGSDAEAAGLIQTWGTMSLAAAEFPVVASGVAAFLTGDVLVLAFAAPFFAFVWLTWPSDDRVRTWLDLHRRG